MKLNSLGVPKKALLGRDPRYMKVFNLYRARLTQEIFRILNESFWERARTGSDGLIKWRRLADSTIADKLGIQDSGVLETNAIRKDFYEWYGGYKQNLDAIKKKSPRMLDPAQRKVYDKAYDAALKATKSRSKAETSAWRTLSSPPREFAELIGIRTGQLVAATAPGPVKNNRYYPNEDQNVVITSNTIKIDIKKVPHAVAFDEGISESTYCPPRKIMPDDLSMWITIAHDKVMPEVKDLYDQLKAQYTTRELAKTSIQRLRSRSNKRSTKKRVRNPSRRKRP